MRQLSTATMKVGWMARGHKVRANSHVTWRGAYVSVVDAAAHVAAARVRLSCICSWPTSGTPTCRVVCLRPAFWRR